MTVRKVSGTFDRGATLVELLVVLLLLSVMVLVAAQLVTHAVLILGATARSARNPITVVVTERLRRDVQEAGVVKQPSAPWTRDALELRLPSGGSVRWSKADGDLVRAALGPSGSLLDSRVVLHGVTDWQWRSPSPRVVDISYGHLSAPLPEQVAPIGTRPGSGGGTGPARPRVENLRFALRGGGGALGW